MNKNYQGQISVFIANLIYGLNYIIAKELMPYYFSPRAVIFCRVSGAMVLFWLFHILFVRESVSKKDLLRLAFCAFWGIAVNQIMFFEGLNLTTPINSSIIMTVNPVLVLIFSYFIIKEKITLKKIIGISLGATGAIILILNIGDFSLTSKTFTGNLFILINAASFALYLVLLKPLTSKYKTATIMKWIFIFGFCYIFPICIKNFIDVKWEIIPVNIWLSLLYVIIGATFFGYLLYNWALKFISASATSFYIYFQPFFAALFALMLGKDTLDIIKIISAILIFSGVYFINKK